MQWNSNLCILHTSGEIMQINIIDISDSKNYNKKDWPEDGIILFSDEWSLRKEQCQNFIKSQNKVFDRKIYARQCDIKQITNIKANSFFDKHHIQGSNNLGVVFFGLFHKEELVGAMSLGRHSRQISNNRIVLDRFCIASGIHISGGASKLFNKCIDWAKLHKYDEIISFSDNRWTSGKIYEILGFSLEKNHKPDYCYVDSKSPVKRISKQSQKKSSSKCPSGMTEFEWANVRGLKRLWDKGKKRWVYHLNPNALSWTEKLSAKCAEQNRRGDFKHSHIRGYFYSNKCKCEIYYSSSYELRCMYLLDQNEKVKYYKRAETFLDSDKRNRNPDIHVEYMDGSIEILEVKPERRFQEEDSVKKQIDESIKYCTQKGYNFSVWSEKDSGLTNEHSIINWARKFIAETTGNTDWLEKQKQNNRKKAKKHYDDVIAKNTVAVWCDYCKETHQPLRLTYEKNIARNNGQYICEKHGGFIAGSKPKKKKDNPHAAEGKKQCSKCKEVKLFNEFGIDKGRPDGYATRCKICRSDSARKKYNGIN